MAIVDVIKYNGGPEVFAWKYPSEELGTWTQLIVNETQQAILVKGGQVLDVFEAGRHTLETANIPFLSKLINLPFGGRSPFTAEVWYINKVYNFDIKWGTPTPIQIQDPKYGVFVPVSANGAFGIQIGNAKKFLIKLVGTLKVFDETSVTRYFRSLYITKVKDSISSYLVHKGISVLEINAYIDELSRHLRERMQPVMEEYGVDLVNFYVNEISVPEDDTAVRTLKDALSRRAEMDIIGYSYQQERSFDTLESAANNTGSSAGLMGAGMGIGMGIGMGRSVGNSFSDLAREIQTSSPAAPVTCPDCGTRIPASSKFCPECGHSFVKKCPECGLTIQGTPRFCPECGHRF